MVMNAVINDIIVQGVAGVETELEMRLEVRGYRQGLDSARPHSGGGVIRRRRRSSNLAGSTAGDAPRPFARCGAIYTDVVRRHPGRGTAPATPGAAVGSVGL